MIGTVQQPPGPAPRAAPPAQSLLSALSAHPNFRLATNPFAPIAADGTPEFDYRGGSLSPQPDIPHLKYYFDHYAWKDPTRLFKIQPNGLQTFAPPAPGAGTVILLSGFKGHGRKSLHNLLYWEISKTPPPPILVQYTAEVFPETDKTANAILNIFLSQAEQYRNKHFFASQLYDRLRDSVTRWKNNSLIGPPPIDILFDYFRGDLQMNKPKPPVIFSLDASTHAFDLDVWRPTCSMLCRLADYIIVSFSDFQKASILRTNLVGQRDKPVETALVDAPRVRLKEIRDFLEWRLSDHRSAPPAPAAPKPDLAPFTEDALGALISPGSLVRNNGSSIDRSRQKAMIADTESGQSLSIKVVIDRLAGAFSEKCHELEHLLVGNGGAISALPTERVQITRSDMEGYMRLSLT
jgi:hypothetical protein